MSVVSLGGSNLLGNNKIVVLYCMVLTPTLKHKYGNLSRQITFPQDWKSVKAFKYWSK